MTEDQVNRAAGKNTIVVNDAWRMAPWADVLYACDANWWAVSGPKAGQFGGALYSCHSRKAKDNNNKSEAAKKYRLTILKGAEDYGFSFDLGTIHYGGNSGFQAINLALQFGASKIWLLGFDMRYRQGEKTHFFGDHPAPLSNGDPKNWIGFFDAAARMLPPGIEIINATPDSALTCFPRGTL